MVEGSGASVQREREELFARLVDAYLKRDFTVIERVLAEDAVLHLPGTSAFAGEHHGREFVSRLFVGLRQFLESQASPVSFVHEGSDMVATQDVVVHGPKHDVEMLVKVTIRFDPNGQVEAVYVQLSDIGLFDHVVAMAMLNDTLGL